MPDTTVIPPGEGEIVGDTPDRRVEILSDSDPLHATWSRFGPGRDGAGLHIHHHHTDLFYVLDGELTVRLGVEDEQVAIGAGTLARVPPLVVHGFRNASAADVRYLNLHAPGCGFADFMRGLRDGTGVGFDQHEPPADGGRPVSEAVVGGARTAVDEPCRRVEVLCDEEAIAVARIELGPGAPPEPAADFVYLLAGGATLTYGGGELNLAEGSWAGAVDGAELSTAQETRYLAIRVRR